MRVCEVMLCALRVNLCTDASVCSLSESLAIFYLQQRNDSLCSVGKSMGIPFLLCRIRCLVCNFSCATLTQQPNLWKFPWAWKDRGVAAIDLRVKSRAKSHRTCLPLEVLLFTKFSRVASAVVFVKKNFCDEV